MKTRVTIELNDNAEDGVIEKSIVVAWCEQYKCHEADTEWWYSCKGFDGDCLQAMTSGTAPIDHDIKEILKQLLCETVDKMEES